MGVLTSPQLRSGADYLVYALPMELLRKQNALQLGWARCPVLGYAIPRIDLAHRTYLGGQVPRVQTLSATSRRPHSQLDWIQVARTQGHPDQRAGQEADGATKVARMLTKRQDCQRSSFEVFTIAMHNDTIVRAE